MTTHLFINENQQRQLAALLEVCPSMSRQRDRDLVVGQLAPEIRRQIRSEGKPANVVMEMVAACANYTDGIENLVHAVAAFEGDSSIPMARIWDNLPEILGFFDDDDQKIVAGILKGLTETHIDRGTLEAAFKESLSVQIRAEYGLPRAGGMCRWWMLREAANVDQGSILRDFARRLLAGVKKRPRRFFGIFGDRGLEGSTENIETLLGDWAAHRTGEPVAPSKRSEKAMRHTDGGSPDRPHLIVQLAPNLSPAHDHAYRVSFHLHSEKSDGRSLADPDKELEDLGIGEIEKELDEFLRRLEVDALPKAIEIMVPVDYLTAVKPRPHLWRLKAGRRKGRLLGKKYPVYMRLNRYKRPAEDGASLEETPADQRLSWKTKWRRFTESKSPGACIQWECDPGACSWDSLDKTLCHSKGLPCLVMAFEPEIPPDDAWLDDVLLESGVPVALWGDVGEADIKTLIDGGSLRSLPARLWEKRDATDREEYPYRLTLLWDNPERDIHGHQPDPERPKYFDDSSI